MLLNWLLGALLPDSGGGPGWSGFVLFAIQVVVTVVQAVWLGKARRHALQAERYAMRAEESARRAWDSANGMKNSRV